MIIVWGSVEGTADSIDQLLEHSLEHVVRSRGEPGCISHNVLIDAENRGRLKFYEEWEDMAALRTHFAVDKSVEFVEKITKLAIRPPEIRIFEALQIN